MKELTNQIHFTEKIVAMSPTIYGVLENPYKISLYRCGNIVCSFDYCAELIKCQTSQHIVLCLYEHSARAF